MGNGEIAVVANVGATRLPCVADEILALVTPHPLGGHHEDHDAEDEHHGEPDAAKGSGVLVDPTDEALQCRPVHAGLMSAHPHLPLQTQWELSVSLHRQQGTAI